MSRLNPKLTAYKRNPTKESPITSSRSRRSDNDSDEEDFDAEDLFPRDDGTASTNPNVHLLHNGPWVKYEYNGTWVGRLVPKTGCWGCCGVPDHLSMYCASLQARVDWVQGIENDRTAKIDEVEYKHRRKETLLNHIKMAQETNPETYELVLSKAELAIKEECKDSDNSFNAPMLVAWLTKNYKVEPTAVQGLQFLQKHMETGEGCFLMHKHGITDALDKIHKFYLKNNPPIQLLLIQVLQQLLDCNFTRDPVISKPDASRMSFAVLHIHMNSPKHVEAAMRCLMQSSRSEVCRIDIMGRNYIPYIMQTCKRFSKTPSILRSTLKFLTWLSTDVVRMEAITKNKGIALAIQCIMRYSGRKDVVGPAVVFLSRMGGSFPPAMVQIIRTKLPVMEAVVQALKLIHDDEEITIQVLRLMQTISKTSEGWEMISTTKGAWQLLTQGTTQGDALIHDLPNTEFYNPGWCIGETPNLPILEKSKLKAKVASTSSIDAVPRVGWTSMALQQFQGLSMEVKKLDINVAVRDTYFDLVNTLDLLPVQDEGRENWFKRIKVYERENDVLLDEMVTTVLQMKRRDAITRQDEIKAAETAAAKQTKMAEDDLSVDGVAKPLYVQGKQATQATMAEEDLNIEERMARINPPRREDTTKFIDQMAHSIHLESSCTLSSKSAYTDTGRGRGGHIRTGDLDPSRVSTAASTLLGSNSGSPAKGGDKSKSKTEAEGGLEIDVYSAFSA